MKCADPVLCYTSQGKKQYRHWSLATHVYRQVAQMVFNCNQCLYCRKKRAYELACRCVLHSSLYQQNCFITLTYDETKPGYHNTFEYPDIQKFKKRLRQHARRNHGKKIEVFNVHEYGKNGKKHWHLIVFNWAPMDKLEHSRHADTILYTSPTLTRLWRDPIDKRSFGFSTVGDVTAASSMYQAQYCEKDLKNGNRHNSKKSHSKHSGIGRPYFLAHYQQLLKLGYVPIDGKKLPLPRYFQKLAHKHYCHFYEKSAFFDLSDRKAIYRPFKKEEPNKEIADLYVLFDSQKKEKILEHEQMWNDLLSQYLETKEAPDFVKSGSNALYDLQKKLTIERF